MIDDKQFSKKKQTAAQRLVRTEAYAEKVRALFASTVNQILALNKTMPKLDEGVMYSFDGESMKKQKEVEALLRRLSSTVTLAVQNGIKLEWENANKECDQFITSIFGKKVLSSPNFAAWIDRNTAARNAFVGRTEKGLNLSDRVWKSVKQLREEMEVAMTVAIGEGDSASSMSRKVREYLNDPDLMFRRFRYKSGEKEVGDEETGEVKKVPVYGKKWKKRVKDEKTGKYKWIDYDRDDYKTGAGVYKSSARNAMRVTRTETNIAYRRADNARWQNMDFVLGQHIELSRSHPKKDICDDLAGDYPKDFVFDGWHPQCYSEDSEVLTDSGWKLFKDVEDSDLILSLNPETRNVEWVSIIDKQRYYRNDGMVRFFNRSIDCLVTSEHQMVYLNKSDGRIKRCPAAEYTQSKGALYRGCEYNADDVRIMDIGGVSYDFDAFCEFMGYWLSDGCLERQYGIIVAQKEGQKYREAIADCIRRLGFEPHYRKLYVIFYNKAFNAFLSQFGKAHDKFMPKTVKEASGRQIRLFLDAFIKCDGSVREKKSFVDNRRNVFNPKDAERLYYTTSDRLAGDLSEMLLKVGHHPSFSIQEPSVRTKKDGSVIKGNYRCWKIRECASNMATVFSKEAVPYDGYVYDLSLERNHIMYIRRNGKCFWGSNCFCVCTPILVDESEMIKVNKAFLKGEKYTPKGKKITEYPQGFKDWITEHKDNIALARKKGTEPYFIRNNAMAVDNIINPQAQKKLTPLEIARQRHDARTPEQVEAIKRAAVNRSSTRKFANKMLDYASANSDVDTSKLQEALKSGNDELALQEARAIKKAVQNKIHPAIKKTYVTNADVNETFKQINIGLSEKWFENGDLDLAVETSRNNNGSTNMHGLVKLRKERIDGVKAALSKIGNGKWKDITDGEADAMATLWHEITHNRNKQNWADGKFQRANFCNTALQRSFMELANEYVARNTLSEFYKALGCKEIPHPEYIKSRASTGYNDMVTNYDYVVTKLGLDEEKVLNAVRNHLYNEPYNDQQSGLMDGLLQGGIKDKDGKALKKAILKSLVGKIRTAKADFTWDGKNFVHKKKEEILDEWMRQNGII